jgi:hypothetical protein
MKLNPAASFPVQSTAWCIGPAGLITLFGMTSGATPSMAAHLPRTEVIIEMAEIAALISISNYQ